MFVDFVNLQDKSEAPLSKKHLFFFDANNEVSREGEELRFLAALGGKGGQYNLFAKARSLCWDRSVLFLRNKMPLH